MNRYYFEALCSFRLSNKELKEVVELVRPYVLGFQLDSARQTRSSKRPEAKVLSGKLQLVCPESAAARFVNVLRFELITRRIYVTNFRSRSVPADFDYANFNKINDAQIELMLGTIFEINDSEVTDNDKKSD